MLASNILQGLGYVLEVLTLIVVVRVIISWIPGLNPYHPLVRVIRAIADPILAPFRGLLPSFGGMLDISPLLALIVLEVLANVCFSLSYNVGVSGASVGYILASGLEQLVLTLIVIVAVLVLLRFLLSLFHADPWHPLTRGIRAMAQPFCRPFDGIVAHRSGIDVEALIAFVTYLVVFLVAKVALDWLVGLL
ncbi:MAG: YggT family protein [Candidatus Dormiibacterota bacterium]